MLLPLGTLENQAHSIAMQIEITLNVPVTILFDNSLAQFDIQIGRVIKQGWKVIYKSKK